MDKMTKQDIIDKINEIEYEGQAIEEDDEGLLHITIKLQDGVLCSISWRDSYPDNLVTFTIWLKRELLIADWTDINDFVRHIQNIVKKLQDCPNISTERDKIRNI